VADGDRLGKTIIFAKNHDHAVFIYDRFNANYPHYKGDFARVIDFKVEYVQSLIDKFSIISRLPHIAISVDMLDTGIDIPEVVNLVFFKTVRSKTKFWQMVGRGTRLCPGLFGLGKDKTCFRIFDYCENLEFFSMNPATSSGSVAESLSKKLFENRVELISELDKQHGNPAETNGNQSEQQSELRDEVAERLRLEVVAMNVNNFIVRPKRRLVEKYAGAGAWETLGDEEQGELVAEVAGLPSELVDDDQDAKQFDLLMLRLQLGLLRHERSFTRLSGEVREIAAALEEKVTIPMVRAELELILEVQTDEFWQDITTSILETTRKRLRTLVKFIEKKKRRTQFADFTDELGEETAVQLLTGAAGHDVERFREKALHYLKGHENDPVILKLRWNEPLTASDLDALGKMLIEAGAGTASDISKIRTGSGL
jgi:type I restriction enzyme R subunit